MINREILSEKPFKRIPEKMLRIFKINRTIFTVIALLTVSLFMYRKYKITLYLLVVFSILLSVIMPMVSVYTSSEDEYTYATATLKIVDGTHVLYSTIKLKVPKYIYVDKEIIIETYFSRTDCLFQSSVIFTIGARIKTNSGTKDYDLIGGSFSLDCSTPSSQTKELHIVIPKTIYEQSVDKSVIIYIKGMAVSPSGLGRSSKVITNVPVNAYLVYGVPQPRLSIKDVEDGYLNLTTGESKNIVVLLTSMNAPLLVENINVSVPKEFVAYVNTPLPLTVGTNETKPIMITVRGVQPGIGILSINIYYYTGVETKRIGVYIPVVCEQDRIYKLIDQYRQEISKLYQKVHELENRLGVNVATSKNLVQRLNNIIAVLNTLASRYNDVLKKNSVLENKIAGLGDELNKVEDRINSLSYSINSYENKYSTILTKLTNELNTLRSDVSMTTSRLNATEDKVAMLKTKIDELQKTITAMAGLLVVFLITAIILVIKKNR